MKYRKKRIPLILITVYIFLPNLIGGMKNLSTDFSMAEACIESAIGLKKINSGNLKIFSDHNLFKTPGFKLISDYLGSVEGWDINVSKRYIESLFIGKKGLNGVVRGYTTKKWEARTKKLWKKFLKNPAKYKKILESLKSLNLRSKAMLKAGNYLPGKLKTNISLSVVLFGHALAFSVNNSAAVDLLQIPLEKKGKLIPGELIDTIAHEIHHIGFNYYSNKGMESVPNRELISLVGLLASEGIPTYYIDKPFLKLKRFRKRKDILYKRIYLDWIYNRGRLDELYREAEEDIMEGLRGNLSLKAIILKWDLGVKGPVYILGADMISVIDKYLGQEKVMEIIGDYRKLLSIYNLAAEIGGRFKFKKKLAVYLSNFSGEVLKNTE